MATPILRLGKLSEFAPQQRNANRHTPRGMSLLAHAMHEDGYVAPMTAAADGEVIDGSARLETSAEVFTPDAEAIIVEHDGTRPIVQVRQDIESAQSPQARRISLRANRIPELNLDFDPVVIRHDALTFDITPLWSDAEFRGQLGVTPPAQGAVFGEANPQYVMEYRILVECRDEAHQRELLTRLEEQGVICRALIS